MVIDLVAAEKAAARAVETVGNRLLQKRSGPLMPVAKCHRTDLVTQVDLEAEAELTRLLGEALPGVPIVGEESGGEIPTDAPCWVVDPLDGTANFVAGLPFYCTTVALLWQGRPVVAALYAPEQKELFQARQGAGAFLNSEPIRVAQNGALTRLVVAARPSLNRRSNLVDNLGACAGLAGATLGIRSLGASALELAWVACGRFGAMFHPRLHPWDVAAGALLVAEAGGRIEREGGKSLVWQGSQPVVASNGIIHGAISRIIAMDST